MKKPTLIAFAVFIAVSIAAGIFYLSQKKKGEAPTATGTGGTGIRHPGTGAFRDKGFTLAFSGWEGADGGYEEGCAKNSVCLEGRYNPGSKVRVLLTEGGSCLAQTGSDFRFIGDAYEFDATETAGLQGCNASALGSDTAVAIVGEDTLMTAPYQRVALQETEADSLADLKNDPEAATILDQFVTETANGQDAANVKLTAQVFQAAGVELVQARISQDGDLADLGPIFVFHGDKPKLLTPPRESCARFSGAFKLGETLYLSLSSGTCFSDENVDRIYQWTGTEWVQVYSTSSFSL